MKITVDSGFVCVAHACSQDDHGAQQEMSFFYSSLIVIDLALKIANP